MNIEQFVNDYLQEHRHDVLLNPHNGLVEFAKAFQEKLMREAVEVEVTETCGIASVWIKTKQFKPGQKVKIIIVKED